MVNSMNKSFFLLLFAGLSIQLQAQTLKFLHGRGPTVEVGADTLDLPWAGGLNYAQVNTLDINNDGTADLLVFDRSGNRVLPLIYQSGSGVYRYEAKWRDSLPPIESWVKVHDYNCDGKPDLFVSVPGGIMVYQNVSSAGGCKFNKALTTPWLTTTYSQPTPTNLYVTSQNIPSITAVDGD